MVRRLTVSILAGSTWLDVPTGEPSEPKGQAHASEHPEPTVQQHGSRFPCRKEVTIQKQTRMRTS